MYIVEIKTSSKILMIDLDRLISVQGCPTSFTVVLQGKDNVETHGFSKLSQRKQMLAHLRTYAKRTRQPSVENLPVREINSPKYRCSSEPPQPLMTMEEVQSAIRQGTLTFNGGIVYFAPCPIVAGEGTNLPVGTIANLPDGQRYKLEDKRVGEHTWVQSWVTL